MSLKALYFSHRVAGDGNALSASSSLNIPGRDGTVVKEEGVTVTAEDERDVENFGVIQRLLDARVRLSVVIVLRLK